MPAAQDSRSGKSDAEPNKAASDLRRLARSTGSTATKPEAVGVSVNVLPTGTCIPAGKRNAAELPDLKTFPTDIRPELGLMAVVRFDFGLRVEDFIVSTLYILWLARNKQESMNAKCHLSTRHFESTSP